MLRCHALPRFSCKTRPLLRVTDPQHKFEPPETRQPRLSLRIPSPPCDYFPTDRHWEFTLQSSTRGSLPSAASIASSLEPAPSQSPHRPNDVIAVSPPFEWPCLPAKLLTAEYTTHSCVGRATRPSRMPASPLASSKSSTSDKPPLQSSPWGTASSPDSFHSAVHPLSLLGMPGHCLGCRRQLIENK